MFAYRVFIVIKINVKWIVKNSYGFFEIHSVFFEIGFCFFRIPFKCRHNIILTLRRSAHLQ